MNKNKKTKEITPPNFGSANTQSEIIQVMMGWLHDQECAVVVWTEQEMRGFDVGDLESGMIEWASESIAFSLPEGEET